MKKLLRLIPVIGYFFLNDQDHLLIKRLSPEAIFQLSSLGVLGCIIWEGIKWLFSIPL